MNSISQFVGRIIHGDCIKVMRSMPSHSVDLVIADPPFLVNFKKRDGRQAYPNDQKSDWLKPAFAEIGRVLKPGHYCLSFYGWTRAECFLEAWKTNGFRRLGHFVWVKNYPSSVSFTRACHEQAYLLAKGKPREPILVMQDVLRWNYEKVQIHPVQKPMHVVEPLIRAFSKPGEIVLDPFSGSGTTAVAAKLLGRQFIGIELVLSFCKASRERLQKG